MKDLFKSSYFFLACVFETFRRESIIPAEYISSPGYSCNIIFQDLLMLI